MGALKKYKVRVLKGTMIAGIIIDKVINSENGIKKRARCTVALDDKFNIVPIYNFEGTNIKLADEEQVDKGYYILGSFTYIADVSLTRNTQGKIDTSFKLLLPLKLENNNANGTATLYCSMAKFDGKLLNDTPVGCEVYNNLCSMFKARLSHLI